MRIRRSAAFSAVIVVAGTTLFTGGAAHAASAALSVSALDRGGAAAHFYAYAVNVRTGAEYDLASGKAKRLPLGTYSVATTIWSADDSWTVAARIVSVKRATKVAFDARKGRKVSFAVDDPSAKPRRIQLVLRVRTSQSSSVEALGWYGASASDMYLVPAKSRYLSLLAFGQLEKAGSSEEQPSPYRFDLVRRFAGGLPEKVAVTARRADLAKVAVTIRSSAPGERGRLHLRPAFSDQANEHAEPVSGITEFATLPASIVSYRTPGIFWQTSVDSDGPAGPSDTTQLFDSRPAYKKGATSETFRLAAWGPQLDAGIEQRYLVIRPYSVLSGPAGISDRLDTPAGTSVKVYRGSRLLGQTTGKDLKVKLPTTYAWYKVQLSASRSSANALSAKASATWTFRARGHRRPSVANAPMITAEFAPQGLDASNTAARGSTTTVGLRLRYPPIKSVAVEASFDGGVTWRKLAVKRTGGRFLLKVPNPNAAGFVSLRLRAKDSRGSTLSQTILNAYGIR